MINVQYQFIDLAARDVHLIMQHYKDLKPGVEDYSEISHNSITISVSLLLIAHMHGHKNDHKKQLFCLKGTIPVVYHGEDLYILLHCANLIYCILETFTLGCFCELVKLCFFANINVANLYHVSTHFQLLLFDHALNLTLGLDNGVLAICHKVTYNRIFCLTICHAHNFKKLARNTLQGS